MGAYLWITVRETSHEKSYIPVEGKMLGNEFSSYPQGTSARDALDCDIEALLNNWRVISKSKLGGFFAKVTLTANRGIPEERMVELKRVQNVTHSLFSLCSTMLSSALRMEGRTKG